MFGGDIQTLRTLMSLNLERSRLKALLNYSRLQAEADAVHFAALKPERNVNMEGAREYAQLFSTGQYGRLYIVVGQHARGYTFHIYVLPKNHVQTSHPRGNPNAVEVYGITGGNPGWTETYGWLHRGPWEADFHKLVEQQRAFMAEAHAAWFSSRESAEFEERQRIKSLLDSY